MSNILIVIISLAELLQTAFLGTIELSSFTKNI